MLLTGDISPWNLVELFHPYLLIYRDPCSPSENGTGIYKYYAFQRWLDTLIIIRIPKKHITVFFFQQKSPAQQGVPGCLTCHVTAEAYGHIGPWQPGVQHKPPGEMVQHSFHPRQRPKGTRGKGPKAKIFWYKKLSLPWNGLTAKKAPGNGWLPVGIRSFFFGMAIFREIFIVLHPTKTENDTKKHEGFEHYIRICWPNVEFGRMSIMANEIIIWWWLDFCSNHQTVTNLVRVMVYGFRIPYLYLVGRYPWIMPARCTHLILYEGMIGSQGTFSPNTRMSRDGS